MSTKRPSPFSALTCRKSAQNNTVNSLSEVSLLNLRVDVFKSFQQSAERNILLASFYQSTENIHQILIFNGPRVGNFRFADYLLCMGGEQRVDLLTFCWKH